MPTLTDFLLIRRVSGRMLEPVGQRPYPPPADVRHAMGLDPKSPLPPRTVAELPADVTITPPAIPSWVVILALIMAGMAMTRSRP